MKRFLLPLMLMLLIAGCGKKAQESDGSAKDNVSQPSKGETYLNSLSEIKKAIENDKVWPLKKALSDSPELNLDAYLLDGDTLFIKAIKHNSRKVRDYLISRRVNLNWPNVDKETPIMIAVDLGFENSVRVLLDQKVDLEKTNAQGDTVLHLAIQKENDDFAALLINEGAKIYALNHQNKNVTHLAQEYNVPKTRELIERMLQVEVGAPDIKSYTSLLSNADVKNLTKVVTLYPRIISEFETVNPLAVLVDAKDSNNALMSARLLLSNNANVNGPQGAEETPLIKATKSQKEGLVGLYLDAQADTQISDRNGKSALIYAIESNNPELVQKIMNYSPSVAYTVIINGKSVKFDACKIAFRQRHTTAKEKENSKKILEILGCDFFDRFI